MRSINIRKPVLIGVKYLLISFIFMILFYPVLTFFDLEPEPYIWPELTLSWFCIVVIISPIIEEVAFRFLPITIVKRWTKNRMVLWLTIILVSGIFGYMHGSWLNMLTQGIVGLWFSAAFLKGGLISSVTTHILYNGLAFAIAYWK